MSLAAYTWNAQNAYENSNNVQGFAFNVHAPAIGIVLHYKLNGEIVRKKNECVAIDEENARYVPDSMSDCVYHRPRALSSEKMQSYQQIWKEKDTHKIDEQTMNYIR